jgi:hypothetical protein
MIRGLVQSKEGFLDDDAWNAHHQRLQSISNNCLNMNMTSSNVLSNLQKIAQSPSTLLLIQDQFQIWC